MNSVALLETLASVTVQVAVLLLVGEWLHHRTSDVFLRDRLRALMYLLILLLSCSGLLVPHVRLTVLPALTPLAYQRQVVQLVSRMAGVLVPVWLAGCLVHLCFVVFGLWRESRLAWRAGLLPDEQASGFRRRLTAAGFPPPQPELRVSSQVCSPFVWQFHQPVIVLPQVMLTYPVEEVELVLRHEAAHLAARHPLELFLQRVVETIFWFHPLVRRASRRTAAAREMLCDQAAVNTVEEATIWLRTLIRLVEHQTSTTREVRGSGTLPAGLDLLSDESLLRERTQALLRRFESTSSPTPAVSDSRKSPKVLLTTAMLCCGLLLWLPLNPLASLRSVWSPWPGWSARTLDTIGVKVRDYEVDAHRLIPHRHGY